MAGRFQRRRGSGATRRCKILRSVGDGLRRAATGWRPEAVNGEVRKNKADTAHSHTGLVCVRSRKGTRGGHWATITATRELDADVNRHSGPWNADVGEPALRSSDWLQQSTTATPPAATGQVRTLEQHVGHRSTWANPSSRAHKRLQKKKQIISAI